MLLNTISSVFLASYLGVQTALPVQQLNLPRRVFPDNQVVVLSTHTISLDKRYTNSSFVNEVFRDNILLNMAYMRGYQKTGSEVDWNYVRQPFTYQFALKPGETFAFHDIVLSQYQNKVIKTAGSHFNSQEGFRSDGYLVGDGVCHLASLISWSAKDAGLEVLAPSNHNFAAINEIPRQQGVSIFSTPNNLSLSANQNLYITNNKSKVIRFEIIYDGINLTANVI
jgi:hypothetical protein